MGNILNSTFAIGIFGALNSTLYTLVSEAYGSEDMVMCGIYLHRGRVCLSMLFAVVWILFIFIGPFLEAIGQDKDFATETHLYIICSFPSFFIMGMYDL